MSKIIFPGICPGYVLNYLIIILFFKSQYSFDLLMRKIKRLFDFRRPHVQELDCIDLVIENKIIFLLSWEFTHAWKLRLRPGKLKQKGASGAMMATLPPGITTVYLIVSNCWRSIEIPIHLKHLKLDEQNLSLLGDNWNILKTVNLHGLQPMPANIEFAVTGISPSFQKTTIATRINIHFNHSQFNYYVP